MLGLVVLGSRTWMWTIAAPALAASRQEFAICSGVTGTAGLRPGVSAEPVTAQEIMTFRAIVFLPSRTPAGTAFHRPGRAGDTGFNIAQDRSPMAPSPMVRARKPNRALGVAA